MKSKHTNCYSCSTLDEVANELHQKIMNIPINERLDVLSFEYSQPFINAYRRGHRDARHAVAELVFQTIAEKTFPK